MKRTRFRLVSVFISDLCRDFLTDTQSSARQLKAQRNTRKSRPPDRSAVPSPPSLPLSLRPKASAVVPPPLSPPSSSSPFYFPRTSRPTKRLASAAVQERDGEKAGSSSSTSGGAAQPVLERRPLQHTIEKIVPPLPPYKIK